MPLSPGTWLAHYEIREHLGSGGMGEVYRAHDNKLQREVALKVLPEHFARDPERIARFRREAQLLAQLNHPNIAAIYNFEETGETRFLVMELVLGETLRERIKRGPLPLEESLDICEQITEALEHAHEKPIIHRDLKPANVKVTPQGLVKVLDFGLAKAFGGDAANIDPHDAPTGSLAGTLKGTILGTPAYMSPEQARGKETDKRTDIWALGCVLYELLTGQWVFQSPDRKGGGKGDLDTVQDIIAKVLESEPDWTALPETTPAWLRSLLRRCLEKDLKRRFRDAADVRIEIEETLSVLSSTAQPVIEKPERRAGRELVRWTVGIVLAALAGAAGFWMLRPTPGAQAPTRLAVTMAPQESLALGESGEAPALALSPDGRWLAYVARRGGTQRLYLRPIGEFQAKPIPGTEDAAAPFFSPDGQWIGFFAGAPGIEELKKVPVAGGAAITLCYAGEAWGGTWASDGTIYFAERWHGESLLRVSSSGGTPQVVSRPDVKKGESSHRWPQALPQGDAVLFTIGAGTSFDDARIAVLNTKTGQWKTVLEGGSNPHYVSTGHLLYIRAGTLFAVPFDLKRLEVTGPPVPLVEGIRTSTANGHAQFAVSESGSLAYVPGGTAESEHRLLWVDRQGKTQPVTELRRAYEDLTLSPDGRRLAMTIEGPTWNVWLYDLERGTLTPFTHEGPNTDPLFTPDGKRIVFTSFRDGQYGLFWKLADGSGPEERLMASPNFVFAWSFSSDGRFLGFSEFHPQTQSNLWVLPMEGERKPQPFLKTPYWESHPALSPDGHWIAYGSGESGRNEIYLQPFPGPGAKIQVSTDGGGHPRWASSGRELFYLSGLAGGMGGPKTLAVPIETTPVLHVGAPRLLFEMENIGAGHPYDPSQDAQRFVVITPSEKEAAATQINVVLNWVEELKRRVPSGR